MTWLRPSIPQDNGYKPILHHTEPTVLALEKLCNGTPTTTVQPPDGHSYVHESTPERENIAANRLRQGVLSRAKRVAIEKLYGTEAAIQYSPEGIPTLQLAQEAREFSLSISHSRHYLALLVAPLYYRVGVDIEAFRPQVLQLLPRFLSEKELQLFNKLPLQGEPFTTEGHGDTFFFQTPLVVATQMWCAKEAAFKVLAPLLPRPNFRDCYRITGWRQNECTLQYDSRGVFLGEAALQIPIQFSLQADYCLAWCRLSKAFFP